MKKPCIVPLPNKSNVAIVFEQLETLIAGGYWEPEQRILSEAELCVKFNVGRSTIREALNMLKARNIVYTVPGLGTFVAKRQTLEEWSVRNYIPDPKSENDLLNIMEIRLSLEPMSAAFAARRATRGQIEEIFEKHHALSAQQDTSIFAEADMEFHMQVARSTGNPMFEDAMNMVRSFLIEQQIFTSQEQWRRDQAGKFHAQILDAVVRRDDVAAEDIMREHMEDTYLYIKSLIGAESRESGRWIRRKRRSARLE